MSAPNTNPISYNQFIQQVGIMAVAETQEVAGVWEFVDPPLNGITTMILNYSENRICRDLDMQTTQTANTYTLTAGTNVFPLPINDFLTVQTVEWQQAPLGPSTPMLPVSKEFIQNVYGPTSFGPPTYFAMYGDTFGGNYNTNNNILLGPTPNYTFAIRVTGTVRPPSLYTYAMSGPADTSYTYISVYYPDMLLMASMIYISAFQRQFSAASDDVQMAMTYEKQYQALRISAIQEENRKKLEGSGWSAYSTPTSATPTR